MSRFLSGVTITQRIRVALIVSLLLAAVTHAATYTAASCKQADVNALINGPSHVAINNDVIRVPAGSCTWTTGIVVPNGIGISIIGAAGWTTGTTTILDAYTSAPSWLFHFRPSPSAGLSRFGYFTLSPVIGSQGLFAPVAFQGTCNATTCPNIRVDHVTFPASPSWAGLTKPSGSMIVTDNVFGVIDHNAAYLDTPAGGSFYEFLNFNHSAWKGVGQYGDNSWTLPSTHGTNEAIFVEDNYFELTGAGANLFPITESEGGFGYERWGGGRVVCRFNKGVGLRSMCANHGTESGGRMRSGRQMEYYFNSMSCPSSAYPGCWNNGYLTGAGARGGTLMQFRNSFTGRGINSFATLAVYRTLQSISTFGPCDGTGKWDWNDPKIYYSGTISAVSGTGRYTITVTGNPGWTPNQWVNIGAPFSLHDSTINNGSEIVASDSNSFTVSSWSGSINYQAGDAIQIRKAIACIDQSSRIGGTLLAGDPPSPTNASLGWQNQTLEPVYEAGDTSSNVPVFGPVTSSTNRVIADRDFYQQVSQTAQTSPTSPFNGTTGTGYGLLSNRPTTCKTGVGYWATDKGTWNQNAGGEQGQLYVCTNSGGVDGPWTLYYTPYAYPHPLTRSTVGTVAPASPLSLRVQ